MKQIILVLALMSSILLCACTKNADNVNIDIKALADGLKNEVAFSEELTNISNTALLRRYGLTEDDVSEAYGYSGTRAVVDEIAVFKSDDTKKVEEQVQAHLDSQTTNYTSYAPNEVPKLDDAVVSVIGDCVVVCVSNDDAGKVISKIAELAK